MRRIALVNPAWRYDGSIYFGCREPHLPLELGYAKAMLERAGHAVTMLDGQLDRLDAAGLAERVAAFGADMTVVTTAPTYLFWRCAPPELRVPAEFLQALGSRGGRTVAVGPHGSATPAATLRKLGVERVVMGECEEVLVALAASADWRSVAATAGLVDDAVEVRGGPAASRVGTSVRKSSSSPRRRERPRATGRSRPGPNWRRFSEGRRLKPPRLPRAPFPARRE